ncbi:MAG TPA: RdgB/HAM1 family non-canonical purine NTP pyrophosphatase [Mycobacterium sp.]|nr:RdgB/HAM1 family non-canonical purine NTP pyrophosphatase [Mycobacterium sp.]
MAVSRRAARVGGVGEEGVRKLTELLVASRNRKKLAELRRVLDGARVVLTLLSLDQVAPFDEAPESGATFEENALAKARDAFMATGLASVADDSGLEVDALNGMPGVLSARWSGRHGDDSANTALLLAQMDDVPEERRGAAFVSACALVYRAVDARKETVVRGAWPGSIVREPRGDGGFGYDPVFLPSGSARTAAELTPDEKDAESHRGRALAALLPALRELAN